MTPVKIIALVFIIFALVKLLVVSKDPAVWKPVIKAVYGHPAVTIIISLAAAVLILLALLKEITIVQIFASMTFMMALMMIQFAALGNELIELSEKFFNDRAILKKIWFSMVIWLVLMGWTLYEIFV